MGLAVELAVAVAVGVAVAVAVAVTVGLGEGVGVGLAQIPLTLTLSTRQPSLTVPIRAHAPPHLYLPASTSIGQIHRSGLKSAGAPAPVGLATSILLHARIHEISVDCFVIVAADDKAASGSDNLLVVIPVVEANLQKAAIPRPRMSSSSRS